MPVLCHGKGHYQADIFSKPLIVTCSSAALGRDTLATNAFHLLEKLILVMSVLYFMEPFLQNREINEM